MANEIGQRFIAFAQVLILAALLFVVWQVRGMRRATQPTSGSLEWTVNQPGRAPVKITLDLYVDETEAEWRVRQEEALRRAEVIR